MIGSLFSGAGGLDLAVEHLTGLPVAWQCELDPHASTVLATRWGVPNLGDITAVDWSTVPEVSVLCGGFPCQDISNAGLGAGIDGARSGLWRFYADAVRVLRPRLVFVENVSAILARGLGRVVGDLAALGYGCRWGCVRASDAGAPHRRDRLFIVATDTYGAGRQGRGRPVERPRELAAAAGGVEPLLPTPTAADGERRSLTYCRGNPTLIGALKLLPTPCASDSKNNRNITAGRTARKETTSPGWTLPDVAFADRWGDYGDAIARWERIVGRPAPDPVDDCDRLNPPFVEWMMGWPQGHVTDLDLPRTAMLRCLGNGVVPQQAELAFRLLEEGS